MWRSIAVVGLATGVLLVIGVMGGLAIRGPLNGPVVRLLDAPARRWAVDHASREWARAFRACSLLGSPVGAALAVGGLGAWFGWRKRTYRPLGQLALAYAMATFLTIATKVIVRRSSPAGPLTTLLGGTYPSGQALLATAVFALAGLLAVRRRPSAWAERVVSVTVALTVVVAVAVARVYLLAHFASDVLASLCLGTASAVVIVAATDVGRGPGRLGARGPSDGSAARASGGAEAAPHP